MRVALCTRAGGRGSSLWGRICVASTIVVTGLAVTPATSPATATESVPSVQAGNAGGTPPAAAAPIGAIFFASDSLPRWWGVTLPGRREAIVAGVFNFSSIPATAWIRFHLWCTDRKSKEYRVSSEPTRVRLPPNPSRPPSSAAQRYFIRLLRTPKQCVHHEFNHRNGLPDGTFLVTLQTGRRRRTEYAETVFNFSVGRPFTRANARWNLGLHAGRRGPNYQAHHTLPVKFEARFRAAGLNIHEPEHLCWWCSKAGVPTNHQSNADQYNARWGRWLRNHPRATQSQILDFRDWLSRQYVYRCPR